MESMIADCGRRRIETSPLTPLHEWRKEPEKMKKESPARWAAGVTPAPSEGEEDAKSAQRVFR